MAELGLESSIVDWVVEHPELIPFFEKRGIDYCCGGRSLEYACRERGIEPRLIIDELQRNETSSRASAKERASSLPRKRESK